MITALMLDDEKLSIEQMQVLIKSEVPEISKFYATTNPDEARLLISQEKPQLVFLDVEMPGLTGFEFLQSLDNRNFAVIFSTAFSKYAVQALRFSAIDFLLKPVQPDELKMSVKRFLEHPPVLEKLQQMYGQLFKNLESGQEKNFRLSLSKGNRLFFVAPSDISYCAADDNYTILHTVQGEEYTMSRTLKDIEEMLTPYGFIRVHKSFLVNSAHVLNVENNEQLQLKGGKKVVVSRRRMEEVRKMLVRI